MTINHTLIHTLHPKPYRPVERIPNGTRVAVCLSPRAGERATIPGTISGCKFTRPMRYDVDPDNGDVERMIGVIVTCIEIIEGEKA